jgi:hypothetical protein
MKIIPRKEPQAITYDMWQECTPYENKFELIDGNAFWTQKERMNLLLMLAYNTGLEGVCKRSARRIQREVEIPVIVEDFYGLRI